jgi:hypothetical protein
LADVNCDHGCTGAERGGCRITALQRLKRVA